MKNKRLVHLIICLIFMSFVYVQINDTDPLKWILIYGSIVLLSATHFFKYPTKLMAIILTLVLAVNLIMNIDLPLTWIKAGKPAFIDYEPTNIQEVENIREFLGLAITFFTATAYIFILNKK